MNTAANIHHVNAGDSTFINAFHLGYFFFRFENKVLSMFQYIESRDW